MQFTTDSDRIQAASGDIARIAADIETAVAHMQARLSGLTGAWTGAAATQFADCVSGWSGVQRQVREQLEGIGRLTSMAGDRYRSAEEEIRASFAR